MTNIHRTPIPNTAFSHQNGDAEEMLGSLAIASDSLVELFRERFLDRDVTGRVLDLGCGPAAIAIQFARAFPTCRIDRVDGDAVRLGLGRKHLVEVGLQGRITLIEGQLPEVRLSRERYQVVISNYQLHRLNAPDTLWTTVRRHADASAMVFVMDLRRPETLGDAKSLAQRAAGTEPALRHQIIDSLLAAYQPAEVRQQLDEHGYSGLQVETIGGGQMLVWGSLGTDT